MFLHYAVTYQYMTTYSILLYFVQIINIRIFSCGQITAISLFKIYEMQLPDTSEFSFDELDFVL